MRKLTQVSVAMFLATSLLPGGPLPASAGTAVSVTTPEWGIPVSWTNPSVKPPTGKTLKLKFTFSNTNPNIKYFNVMHTTLRDSNGFDVVDELSINDITQGSTGSVILDIDGDKLIGTKAPYTIAFDFNGIRISPYSNASESSEFPFAFEVPTTITCVKKGKPNKKITKYRPVCPAGYRKT